MRNNSIYRISFYPPYLLVLRGRTERSGGVPELPDQSGGAESLPAIHESGTLYAAGSLEATVW